MPRSRPQALQSALFVVAVLAGLVGVRWLVTGGLDRPMAPPASVLHRGHRLAPPVAAPVGTRLSLGGREPLVVDPTDGTVLRLPPDPDDQTLLFRHGRYTVMVANGHAWAVPAGKAGPRRALGPAMAVLPALAADRVWLVTVGYQSPRQWYRLVEVGLVDGRARSRWTLPVEATPVAVLSSGVLARSFEDDLQVVEPGSGRVRALLARAATFIDAQGDRVAWLAGRDLHVRDLRTGFQLTVPPPPGSPGWHAHGAPIPRAGCCYGLGAFAPDGRTLAVYARVTGPATPGLAVVDLVRGRAALLPGSEGTVPDGRLPYLAWASDGWLYFFAAGPAFTSIGAWDGVEGPAGLLPLDLDQTLNSVPSALAAN
jgi:hypothetical protein